MLLPLENVIDEWSSLDELRLMPRLLLARAWRKAGDLEQARAQLDRYRTLDPRDAFWPIEAACVALEAGVSKEVAHYLYPLFTCDPDFLHGDLVIGYATALRLIGKLDTALDVLSRVRPEIAEEDAALEQLAEIHFAKRNWHETIDAVEAMNTVPNGLVYQHAAALRGVGRNSRGAVGAGTCSAITSIDIQ